jgi:hypothetical protein
MAGGTANMTDPPTLRRTVVCIMSLQKLYKNITYWSSLSRTPLSEKQQMNTY